MVWQSMLHNPMRLYPPYSARVTMPKPKILKTLDPKHLNLKFDV